jgi:membrane protease YdiL (CAAX protease family)
LTGFSILFGTNVVNGFFLRPLLAEIFPQFPWITLGLLLSVTNAPLAAFIYLILRIGFVPKFSIERETFLWSVGTGMALIWTVNSAQTLVLGQISVQMQGILNASPSYYLLNLFLLILWGPFVEEIFFRGYFLEILYQKHSTLKALLFSSALFTFGHVWGGFNGSLVFIFLASVVFSLVYIKGGLVASILVHIFANADFFYS